MIAVLDGYEVLLGRAELTVRFAQRWFNWGLALVALLGVLLIAAGRVSAGAVAAVVIPILIFCWRFRRFTLELAQAKAAVTVLDSKPATAAHDEDRVARIAEEADRAARRGR